MKLRIFLGAVASIALVGRSASAQMCRGDLAFAGSAHLASSLGVSDNATSLDAGVMVGHQQGLYGGGSLGMIDYDNLDGNSLTLNGGLGYAMPLAQGSKWQLCPGGTLQMGFGPSIDAGAAGTIHMSAQSLNVGASVGTSLPLSQSVNLLPFGSAGVAYTRVKASAGGTSVSDSQTYLALNFGAGFQFTPSFIVRPALGLAVGANDLVDDTVFSLGVSFALPK